MIYKLPKLNYGYNALEVAIDAKTMEIHHTKHHQAYVNNLNTVLAKYPKLAEKSLESLLVSLDLFDLDSKDKTFFKNNAGGHLNHSLYWTSMGPQKAVDEKLLAEITTTYNSLEEFKKMFSDLALKQFGSGWAWLAKNEKGKLVSYALPNQDSPYSQGHVPVFGLDVWEHAYYLRYQNRRADYIAAWWKVLRLLP